MKRLLSTSCSDWAFNLGMLLIRIGAGDKAALFLTCFLVILLCGPGKGSVDGLINR